MVNLGEWIVRTIRSSPWLISISAIKLSDRNRGSMQGTYPFGRDHRRVQFPYPPNSFRILSSSAFGSHLLIASSTSKSSMHCDAS